MFKLINTRHLAVSVKAPRYWCRWYYSCECGLAAIQVLGLVVEFTRSRSERARWDRYLARITPGKPFAPFDPFDPSDNTR